MHINIVFGAGFSATLRSRAGAVLSDFTVMPTDHWNWRVFKITIKNAFFRICKENVRGWNQFDTDWELICQFSLLTPVSIIPHSSDAKMRRCPHDFQWSGTQTLHWRGGFDSPEGSQWRALRLLRTNWQPINGTVKRHQLPSQSNGRIDCNFLFLSLAEKWTAPS